MKKKRIIHICEIVILVALVLMTVEDAAFYTISRNNVESQAVAAAENNGMKSTKVLKTSDQGSSLIVVVQNQGKYGFVAFNKSNLYGCYRINKSYFHTNSDNEIHTVITDPNNMYLLSLVRKQEDISVLIEDKQSRWKDRLTNLGIIMLVIFGCALFRFGLKPSHES